MSFKHALTLSVVALLAACGDEATHEPGANPPAYVVGNMVFGSNGDATSYVTFLDSLEPQTINYRTSREFPGMADLHVMNGAIYLAQSEDSTVTKFTLKGRELVYEKKIGFAGKGVNYLGFWLNHFISPTKAYLTNGNSGFVVWNPTDMAITKTIGFPKLEDREGLTVMAGYSDRAAIVHEGKLYQTLYWTTPASNYFVNAPDSRIAVYDLQDDTLVDVLEAPCPALDFVSRDSAGNLYFSSWVFAPGGAAVIEGQPATCVAKLAAGTNEITKLFDFRDVAQGHEGGVFRILGEGRALFAALDVGHAPANKRDDVATVAYGANWRFWEYDLVTGQAAVLDGIDWNAGAAVSSQIEGDTYLLVPAADSSATKVVKLGAPPTPLFDLKGWGLRLFKLDAQ